VQDRYTAAMSADNGMTTLGYSKQHEHIVARPTPLPGTDHNQYGLCLVLHCM
jgi:hypothetical protein